MCKTDNYGRIFIYSAAVWLLYLCIAYGSPMTDRQDDSLYFQLSKDTVSVTCSAGTEDTTAVLYFSVKDGAPRSHIDEIRFTLALDTSVIHITEVSPTDNWPGMDVSYYTFVTFDSETVIRVAMSLLPNSSITTDTVFVPYARIKGHLACVGSGQAIVFHDTEHDYNYIQGYESSGRLSEYPPQDLTHLIAGEIRSADYVCGDVNADRKINIRDISALINYLYRNGPPPNHDHPQAADVDGNGTLNIQDVTILVNYLYKYGPALICP
ncbi:MAG: dockerin type I domain-containing protein [candidate division Zixibacteria bacterium]|nr:dockerin type I domain-containing protein [candidate division Zixibacteria bacterium]